MTEQFPEQLKVPNNVVETYEEFVEEKNDEELYASIEGKSYPINISAVTEVELRGWTNIAEAFVKIPEAVRYEIIDKFQWELTLLLTKICPGIPKSIGYVEIVHYEDGGYSYRGKRIALGYEEMASCLVPITAAYLMNRSNRIERLMANHDSQLSDDQYYRLKDSLENDRKQLEQIPREISETVIQMYLDGIATSSKEKPQVVSKLGQSRSQPQKPINNNGRRNQERTRPSTTRGN